MIKKYIFYSLFIFIFSCSNIEFVFKDYYQNNNPLKNRTTLLIEKSTAERFTRSLYSFFGNNKEYDYILKTEFIEKKDNRIVKNNQVAEKIEYTLEVVYDVFYKSIECKVYNKKVITRFSFTPKSAGYNFGSDRSFDKLYNSSVDQNIKNFVEMLDINNNCLK